MKITACCSTETNDEITPVNLASPYKNLYEPARVKRKKHHLSMTAQYKSDDFGLAKPEIGQKLENSRSGSTHIKKLIRFSSRIAKNTTQSQINYGRYIRTEENNARKIKLGISIFLI